MKHEKITDEQLVASIDSKVRNSVGGWTNSSDLSRKRENATYEFSLEAKGDLESSGVSKIVSADTTEIVEGYTALITKLLLDNNKLAIFVPLNDTPAAVSQAKMASDVTNYCIFNKQSGWEIINEWVKSALLYGNGTITWGWENRYEYETEEYEEINQVALDEVLSDPMVEIVGDLLVDTGDSDIVDIDIEALISEQPSGNTVVFKNVRLRRKIDMSGIKISSIPPETFLISRDASTIKDASFVGRVTELTHSEIRKQWPDKDFNLEEIGENTESTRSSSWSLESFSRKDVAGVDNWLGSESDSMEDEANQIIEVIECWIKSDRDGDGIAELIHVVKAGETILDEEDVSYVPIACLNPIPIPYEFYGLSMADLVRPQTQASTAILRGFVENVYFGNYGRTLADPNMVDFAALQNPEPKQVIPTNGPAAGAVQQLNPEPISSGTSNMLEYLQLQKEQSTGLTKTAMGLNDTLYVSGNSEAKMAGAQSAAQVRIEHIARIFAETGLKDLCRGILREMKINMRKPMMYKSGKGYASFTQEDLMRLPSNMDLDIQTNVGESSNQNQQAKLQGVGEMLGLMAGDETAKKYIDPMAALRLGYKMVQSMGLDPTDYLLDPDSPETQEQIASMEEQSAETSKLIKEYEMQDKELDLETKEASMQLIDEEIMNKRIDNVRQIYEAQTDADTKWAKIEMEAAKLNVTAPVRPPLPPLDEMVRIKREEDEAKEVNEGNPQEQQQQPQIPPELIELAASNPQQAMQIAEQQGIPLEMLQQAMSGM